MNTPVTIQGPCIIKWNGATMESESDVVVTIKDNTEDKKTITRGVCAKKLLGRSAEIKFKPSKWSLFSTLFAMLSLTKSALIFGAINKPLEVFGQDGTKWTFHRAGLPTLPAIGCGVKKDLMNEFTFVGLPDPTKALSDAASLYTVATAEMPTLPTMTTADFASCGFIAIIGDLTATGDNKGFVVDLEEGAEISLEAQTKELKLDRLGDAPYDYLFKEINVSLKFKPTGIDADKWKRLVNLATTPKVGGIISTGVDIVLQGLYKDDPSFALKGCINGGDRSLTWSDENTRFSEVTLSVLGEFGLNKLTVGTVDADFVAPTES